uniref:Uncharacterized protein n=1 Tax=Aegilops tauschii subsp. strangulata TaxID=200361 RepID=A0A453NA96_AEGTS
DNSLVLITLDSCTHVSSHAVSSHMHRLLLGDKTTVNSKENTFCMLVHSGPVAQHDVLYMAFLFLVFSC